LEFQIAGPREQPQPAPKVKKRRRRHHTRSLGEHAPFGSKLGTQAPLAFRWPQPQ
jgi:hypothetical protein